MQYIHSFISIRRGLSPKKPAQEYWLKEKLAKTFTPELFLLWRTEKGYLAWKTF